MIRSWVTVPNLLKTFSRILSNFTVNGEFFIGTKITPTVLYGFQQLLNSTINPFNLKYPHLYNSRCRHGQYDIKLAAIIFLYESQIKNYKNL